MSKINLSSKLLTETRRKAAENALVGSMRKDLKVVVENGEVAVHRRKDG